jgi:hypothetical protein
VLFVPDIKNDLIFVGQLTTYTPYYVKFFSNGYFIKDMRIGKIMEIGSRNEVLYAIND